MNQPMSTMERILRLMAEKKASDVYLSANSPALIKINGEAVSVAPAGGEGAPTLLASRSSLPPEGAPRLRPGEAGSAAPAGGEVALCFFQHPKVEA